MFAVFKHGITVSSNTSASSQGSSGNSWTLQTAIDQGQRLDTPSTAKRSVHGSSHGDRVVVRSLRMFVDDANYDPQKHRLVFTTHGFASSSHTVILGGSGPPAQPCADCQKQRNRFTNGGGVGWWWCAVCTSRAQNNQADSAVLYSSPLADDVLLRYAPLALDGFDSVDNIRSYGPDLVELASSSVLASDCSNIDALETRFCREKSDDDRRKEMGTCIVVSGTNVVGVPNRLFEHVGTIVQQDVLRNIAVVSPESACVNIEFTCVGRNGSFANNSKSTSSMATAAATYQPSTSQQLRITFALELVALGEVSEIINV